MNQNARWLRHARIAWWERRAELRTANGTDAGNSIRMILPPPFAKMASRVSTYAYMRDGTDRFLASFGPTTYHTAAEYQQAVGAPLFVSSIGVEDHFRLMPGVQLEQRVPSRCHRCRRSRPERVDK